jgi:hypothetical protein
MRNENMLMNMLLISALNQFSCSMLPLSCSRDGKLIGADRKISALALVESTGEQASCPAGVASDAASQWNADISSEEACHPGSSFPERRFHHSLWESIAHCEQV